MSNDLLSSKIVVLEEEPRVPAVAALPSAVVLMLGLFPMGPIGDRNLFTSFEELTRTHGTFTSWSDALVAAWGFYLNGGVYLWASRTCHYTDVTRKVTATATKGTVDLMTAGSGALPATAVGSNSAPYDFSACTEEKRLYVTVGVAAEAYCEITGNAAMLTTGVGPWDLSAILDVGDGTLKFVVNNGPEQTVTISAADFSDTEACTGAELVDALNERLFGVLCATSIDTTEVVTDRQGNLAALHCTGGSLNTTIGFSTTAVAGTGNVGRTDAVTNAEMKAIIEDVGTGIAGLNASGASTTPLTLLTTATGASAKFTVTAGEVQAILGFDLVEHDGSAAAPQATLTVSGKTPGSYTENVTIGVAAATNGVAASFNLKTMLNGVIAEVFPNCTMDDTSLDYVVTRINAITGGSRFIAVEDLHLETTVLLRRPATSVSSALTGGDDGLTDLADIDWIGSQAGATGLHAFDTVSSGTILVVPGNVAAAVQVAMLDYAETFRSGTLFCVLDCPLGYTAAQMVAWLQASGLFERSEFGAVYWPRIQIVNPSAAIFGTGSTITVPTSGWIAGVYARNDQKIGGVYESPAGIGGNFGVIQGMVGVEADPSGGARHEVLDENKRDLLAPYRINPITLEQNSIWVIDGGDTLKSTGNFPNIGERRGVIFIETSIKNALVIMKHRFNNAENRRKVNRIITAFLRREMGKDAFRSKDPKTAFYVDTSDALNPVSSEFAGLMTVRIGLATNKPTKWIEIIVTQDTRALEQELAA